MPGFIVSTYGDQKASVPSDYFMSYTWDISQVFGNTITTNSPIVYLKDATLPSFTVKTETAKGASVLYKFAGEIIWEDCRVSWYDTIGLLQIVRDWRLRVWTPESGLGQPNTYKARTIITQKTAANNQSNEINHILVNSWPTQIRHSDLTYTSSDIKSVEVVLSYDWAEEEFTVT